MIDKPKLDELLSSIAASFDAIAVVDGRNMNDTQWRSISTLMCGLYSKFDGDGMVEQFEHTECLRKWHVCNLMSNSGYSMRAHSTHKPEEYGLKHENVQELTFISMYPNIMLQMSKAGYIRRDDVFWKAYCILVEYRGQIKRIATAQGYYLMKRYLNATYGFTVARDEYEARHFMPYMVKSYANFVMDSLVAEIGIENVVYSDTAVLYSTIGSHELTCAANRIGSELNYDIDYVSEMTVVGYKSFEIVRGERREYHGHAERILKTTR